ncbi:MAG: bifunctional oligoribonuclease/PAP phosphatase NrnA [Candidatus Omnitrophica bacterium]|nr:bifunctional oligoribonuclease/PAP phosphatase NrnA [Candidatus Omnitrophota bacterium]
MEVKLLQNDEDKIEKIVNVLRNKNLFLITSHINLDGDGIGSEIALYLALKKLNKKVKIINQDKIPYIFKFLPYSRIVEVFNEKKKVSNFEVAIIVDCGNLERIGKMKEIVENIPFLINIDHHLSNFEFGDINWINPHFSSCGEMVYFLCDKLGKIDKKQAICLYASILYDTCCFVHHLSLYTMDIVKYLLINKKIDAEKIAQKLFFERSIKSLNLFKLALDTLKFDKNKKICFMKVPKDFFKKVKAKEEDTEGFVEFLVSIKGIEVGVLFKERENGVKVSMRSKGIVDVENIARKFGGGGHREASGCFFENKSIEEVESIIKKELKWTEY